MFYEVLYLFLQRLTSECSKIEMMASSMAIMMEKYDYSWSQWSVTNYHIDLWKISLRDAFANVAQLLVMDGTAESHQPAGP